MTLPIMTHEEKTDFLEFYTDELMNKMITDCEEGIIELRNIPYPIEKYTQLVNNSITLKNIEIIVYKAVLNPNSYSNIFPILLDKYIKQLNICNKLTKHIHIKSGCPRELYINICVKNNKTLNNMIKPTCEAFDVLKNDKYVYK